MPPTEFQRIYDKLETLGLTLARVERSLDFIPTETGVHQMLKEHSVECKAQRKSLFPAPGKPWYTSKLAQGLAKLLAAIAAVLSGYYIGQ